MGEVPSLSVYVSAIGFSLAIILVSWSVFSRVRGRIAFWV
jgi:ABC-type polysaccharide/polyol phosphate export permease